MPDSVRLTKQAVSLGCAAVLILPPFYDKDVSDDGLLAHFAEVINRVGDARLKIYLYHIPPFAPVGFSLSLIERLLKAYPDTIVGIKDSSGDWANTQAMLDAFPDFDVLVGSETFLLANLRAGRGRISATANVNPAAIVDLCDKWRAGGRGHGPGRAHGCPDDHPGPSYDSGAQGDCCPLRRRSRLGDGAAAIGGSDGRAAVDADARAGGQWLRHAPIATATP